MSFFAAFLTLFSAFPPPDFFLLPVDLPLVDLPTAFLTSFSTPAMLSAPYL